QFTVDSNKNTLDALEREAREIEEARKHAERLRLALKEELKKGDVSIQTEGMKVIIHIMENASFDSGMADLREAFLPALQKIGDLIDNNSGEVTISGHTDNVPISNERFRSNWDLSTSRAVSVAHQLLRISEVNPDNVIVTGHADTRPRAPNDSNENRAKNRRVDIAIVRGKEIDEYRTMSLTAVAPIPESTEEQEP
ncbi:MAG: OmpA family protein, partial [Woeseiaceae bacterium]